MIFSLQLAPCAQPEVRDPLEGSTWAHGTFQPLQTDDVPINECMNAATVVMSALSTTFFWKVFIRVGCFKAASLDHTKLPEWTACSLMLPSNGHLAGCYCAVEVMCWPWPRSLYLYHCWKGFAMPDTKRHGVAQHELLQELACK